MTTWIALFMNLVTYKYFIFQLFLIYLHTFYNLVKLMNDLKHFTTCNSFPQNSFRFESQRKKKPTVSYYCGTITTEC